MGKQNYKIVDLRRIMICRTIFETNLLMFMQIHNRQLKLKTQRNSLILTLFPPGKGTFINVSKLGVSLPLSCMVKMIGSWHRSIPPLVQNGVHQSSDHSPLRAHCKQNVLKKLFQVWLTIILQKLLKLLHHQPQIFGRNLLKPQG